MTRFLVARPFALTLSLAALAACGGGDGGTTAPPTTASVGVALASANITVGQSTTATATARDAQGNGISGKSASWSSSNSAVATVSAAGQVSGISVGTADIIATIEGTTGRATISVSAAPVASITVALDAASITAGDSTQAVADVRDAQGNTLTGRSIVWSSSNTAVATVSASGLVTGVAVGLANIVATSEGQSGQAALTVAPGVSVRNLVLTTADGTPIDTSNVAGTFELSADIDLPAGFRGEQVIRLDTVVVARDSVFGASSSQSPAMSLAALRERSIETTSVVRVVTNDELVSVPKFLNGLHTLNVTVSGVVPGGQSLTRLAEARIRTNNANTFRLLTAPTRTLTLLDGRTVASGSITGRLDIVSFDGTPINEVQILRGPAQTIYGSGALSGTVALPTLRGADIRKPFDLGADDFESPAGGTRYLLDAYVAGSQTFRPRETPVNVLGNTPSVDGSGWATPPDIASTITLPTGLRYQQSDEFPLALLGGAYSEWSTGVRYIDNLAPRTAVPGFIAPHDRNYALGGRAFDVTGRLGLSFNYLGANTTFSDLLDLSQFDVDLSGLPAAEDFTWYASASLGELFQQGNRITSLSGLSQSLTRNRYLGARAADGAGNFGEYVVSTSAGNPYTTGSVMAPANQLGTTPALWGKLTSAGSYTETGIPSARVYNAASLAASDFGLRITGGLYDNNAVFGTLQDYFDESKCIRGYDDCEMPQVLGGVWNTSSLRLTFDDPLSGIVAEYASRLGGNGDGAFAARYWAGDVGGNTIDYGGTRQSRWSAYVDRSIPTVDGSITTRTIDDVDFSVSATDALGVESYGIAARFDFDNGLFPGGKLFAWLDWVPEGGDLESGLSTSLQRTLNGPAITHGVFFNNFSGGISGPPFRVIGGTVQSRDWAHNYSDLFHISAGNTFAEPTFAPGVTYKFSQGAGSVCRDHVCPPGQLTDLPLHLDVRSPSSAPPITKASFQLIRTDGSAVYHAGTDVTPAMTQVGSEYNHRYSVNFDAPRGCIPPGSYLAKVMAVDLDRHYAAFTNEFLPVTVTGNNSYCYIPRRPFGFRF